MKYLAIQTSKIEKASASASAHVVGLQGPKYGPHLGGVTFFACDGEDCYIYENALFLFIIYTDCVMLKVSHFAHF